jgi:hypothetical protein
VNQSTDGVQPPESTETGFIADHLPDSESQGTEAEFTPAPVQEFEFPTLVHKKVAIVGFATGHAHKAPFSDPEVECWGINQLWKVLPDAKFDRWFELHSLYDFYHANPGHQEFLRNFEGPVYVRAQDFALALEWGITTAQPFPDQVLVSQFRPYFNNTVSWLLALAIMMHPDWVGLYGVDMAQDHVLQAEYSEQRPSCEYFLGIMEAIGIELVLPGGSDLLKATHLYGYEDSGPVLEKMSNRWQELQANKTQIQAQVTQLESQATQLRGTMAAMEGAMQEVTYWRKNWLTPPAKE